MMLMLRCTPRTHDNSSRAITQNYDLSNGAGMKATRWKFSTQTIIKQDLD